MFSKIPNELKELKQWVAWKKKVIEKGKITKIPVNPNNGWNAKTNDLTTWGTFDQAVEAIDKYKCAGIGFVFDDGYFGIDLDDCSQELIDEFVSTMDSYSEYSVSGKGIHIIARGKLPKGARRRGGVEMYDSGRFFVMTGNAFHSEGVVNDGEERVLGLYQKYLNPQVKGYTYHKSSNDLSEREIVEKAQSAKNSALFNLLYSGQWEGLYDSQSEADFAFAVLLAFWTNKDKQKMDNIFRNSGLMRTKWDREQNGTTYGNITLENAINRCSMTYDPMYNAEQITINAVTGEAIIKRVGGDEYELNDTGNAHRFVDMLGDSVKYNFDNKQWMIWNGKQWINDVENSVKNMAEVVIEQMKKEAFAEENSDIQKAKLNNVQKAYSSRGKEAMLKEATHLHNIPCVNASFDNGHWVINTQSGVIDLTNGNLKEHDRVYMMSKIAGTGAIAGEPTKWLQFLNETFKGDKELIDFIQKAIGYTLTGSIKEQAMFICYGEGSNGKSVFIDILEALMGDYSRTASVDTLLTRRMGNSNSSQDIARLKGARLVVTGEPNEGAKFNEGLVKQLTGGDTITARFLYGQEFEFKPEFKLWLQTNHKPIIRGTDRGIWRRIRLIPFENNIPDEKQDKELTSKLLEELPMIMTWAVEGTLLWIRDGLEAPASVLEATKEYRNEMDVINAFIENEIQNIENWETKASDMYKAYVDWGKLNNEYVMSATKFGREISKRYNKKRKNDGAYYIGVRLVKDDTSYTYHKGLN